MTVQTAFRLEESMVQLMKQRAKLKRQSLNAYVSELIADDLKNSSALPAVKLPEKLDSDILHMSGVMNLPSQDELDSDERLKHIWER